jgi:HAMP domain-containing protein
MSKRVPVDCKKITETHLSHLDDDELGILAQRIEIQTQQLNRAMRLVADAMAARRHAA